MDRDGYWDLARPNWPLYDPAFASLQFGGRECLFDDVSWGLAHLFFRTHAERAGLRGWLSERPEFVRWVYRVTILKRLLRNWHVVSRTRLLQSVDAGHHGWLF